VCCDLLLVCEAPCCNNTAQQFYAALTEQGRVRVAISADPQNASALKPRLCAPRCAAMDFYLMQQGTLRIWTRITTNKKRAQDFDGSVPSRALAKTG
jgi:hypothetical protein